MTRQTHDLRAQVTASGKAVTPFAEGLLSIDLDDIARCLSNQAFGCGHTPRFVSLAQWAVLTARGGPPSDGRYALLWPSPACYLGTVPDPVSPTRHRLPGGTDWADRDMLFFAVLENVLRHFDLPSPGPPLVARLDEAAHRAAQAVARDVGPRLPPGAASAHAAHDPLPERVEPLSPDRAYRAYLDAWRECRAAAPKSGLDVLRN